MYMNNIILNRGPLEVDTDRSRRNSPSHSKGIRVDEMNLGLITQLDDLTLAFARVLKQQNIGAQFNIKQMTYPDSLPNLAHLCHCTKLQFETVRQNTRLFCNGRHRGYPHLHEAGCDLGVLGNQLIPRTSWRHAVDLSMNSITWRPSCMTVL